MGSVTKLLVTIVVIGFLIWLALAFVPLPYPFGLILIIAGVVVCIVLIIRATGWTLP